MSRYYGARYNKDAPSIREIIDHPDEEMYLSGEVVPCNVKDEGKMVVNVVCMTEKDRYFHDTADESWLQPIRGLNHRCYGWSHIGWRKPEEL
jgi:hypothetical protein